MELVLEIKNTRQMIPPHARVCRFGVAGGTIGRAVDCDWTIPDIKKHLSGYHARVTSHRGTFYLTDLSRNGIFTGCGAQLPRSEPFRIEHESVFRFCDFEIHARLIHEPTRSEAQVGKPQAGGAFIPDDAFLELDPLRAVAEPPATKASCLPATVWPEPVQHCDYARIDTENLIVPELVPEPADPPMAVAAPASAHDEVSARFWTRFGQALGFDLQALDVSAREALAVEVAVLLRQSIGGLLQGLHTRSEVRSELRLACTDTQPAGQDPLRRTGDAAQTLRLLLRPDGARAVSAEQALARGYRDLQTHQVAMLAGSRAMARAALEHFTPAKLALRFEQDCDKPLLATPGSRWRAFQRYHQRLCQDDVFAESLLASAFAQAYDEQARLIATLHCEQEG